MTISRHFPPFPAGYNFGHFVKVPLFSQKSPRTLTTIPLRKNFLDRPRRPYPAISHRFPPFPDIFPTVSHNRFCRSPPILPFGTPNFDFCPGTSPRSSDQVPLGRLFRPFRPFSRTSNFVIVINEKIIYINYPRRCFASRSLPLDLWHHPVSLATSCAC